MTLSGAAHSQNVIGLIRNNMEGKTVNEIIKNLKDGKLENPSELADFVVILSASLFTGGQIELDLDITYSEMWSKMRPTCKTDKECDMRAKGTQEYRDMQIARITNKTIQQTIMALKKKLANLQFEFSQGQNY